MRGPLGAHEHVVAVRRGPGHAVRCGEHQGCGGRGSFDVSRRARRCAWRRCAASCLFRGARGGGCRSPLPSLSRPCYPFVDINLYFLCATCVPDTRASDPGASSGRSIGSRAARRTSPVAPLRRRTARTSPVRTRVRPSERTLYATVQDAGAPRGAGTCRAVPRPPQTRPTRPTRPATAGRAGGRTWEGGGAVCLSAPRRGREGVSMPSAARAWFFCVPSLSIDVLWHASCY